MTVQELANHYVALIRQNKHDEIRDSIYSADITCHEPEHAAALGVPTLTTGIVAVKAKAAARAEMIEEIHSAHCSDPVVGGNYFSVAMGRDITFKNKMRKQIDEIAVFQVKDNKIVSERFFF